MRLKSIGFTLLCTLFLVGCAERDLTKWNQVAGKKRFELTEEMTCTILTSTDNARLGEIFQLSSLTKASPQIRFQEEGFAPHPMKKLEESDKALVFASLSQTRGAIMLIFEKETGVFALSTSSFGKEPIQNASKGNCEERKN